MREPGHPDPTISLTLSWVAYLITAAVHSSLAAPCTTSLSALISNSADTTFIRPDQQTRLSLAMKHTSVLVLSAVAGAANAHICMWSPLQRQRDGESYDISSPGNTMCRNTADDVCGGVPAGPALTHLTAGEPYTIAFQQNLNHFYVGYPGTLVADFASVPNPTEADFAPLDGFNDYNAMNEITQTNFTLSVKIPDVECEQCVLRLRYAPHNPLEPEYFYQCSDVSVTSSAAHVVSSLRGSSSISSPTEKESVAEGPGVDCCAPAQFSMQAYETASWRNPTQLNYYFDTEAQLQRIDTNSGSGTTIYDGHFQMYSNYSSGAEAYYNVVTGDCVVYGLDLWNNWCFGSINDEQYVTSVMVGNEVADVWQVPGLPFSWTSTRENCLPVSLNRYDTGETTFYYNMNAVAPSAEVFQPPPACVTELARVAQQLESSTLPLAPFRHSNSNSLRKMHKKL